MVMFRSWQLFECTGKRKWKGKTPTKANWSSGAEEVIVENGCKNAARARCVTLVCTVVKFASEVQLLRAFCAQQQKQRFTRVYFSCLVLLPIMTNTLDYDKTHAPLLAFLFASSTFTTRAFRSGSVSPSCADTSQSTSLSSVCNPASLAWQTRVCQEAGGV